MRGLPAAYRPPAPTTRPLPLPCAIAVVDPHEAIRTAVELWCRTAQPATRYVRGFSSADRFLAASGRLAAPPGVVIVDPALPGGDIDVGGLGRIVAAGHRVVVYSAVMTDRTIAGSMRHGALTCLMKSEDRQHLLAALRAAGAGLACHGIDEHARMVEPQRGRRVRLAPREHQILIAWLRAETRDDVARELSISPATVRTHLARIRAKYAAAGRPAATKAALVARAIQDRLMSLDDL
ncbi:LuxR family transcriptional regulator [Mycolicibacterium canariasense]|uniref:LuxR family transcriptional regulator n=2 Tax=Mycolicibacterium canariasense TaxID=228230 RepID=A0A100WGI9_MYCCR|nr:hypothetical protein AWB94_02480 [Mycolicibacterium canariasense]GAS97841.1 LuxR family transcriptional regulator [Mycolicibacterium canariasense]